jgi:hypothetical protein
MKISEMIKNLQEFMAENGDIDCYYAVDDEGNAYHPVYFKPSKYYINEEYGVMQLEDLEYYELHIHDVEPICIVN